MIKTTAILAAILVGTPAAFAQGWSELAGSATNGGPAAAEGSRPAMASDEVHNVYVAWIGTGKVRLLKWDVAAGAWAQLDGSAGGMTFNTTGTAEDPRVACGYDTKSAQLKVFVAWAQVSGSVSDIRAKMWASGSGLWSDLGSVSATGKASQPSLALDFTREEVTGPWNEIITHYVPFPCVAYVESTVGSKGIVVRGLNDAGSWDDMFHTANHAGPIKSDAASAPSLGLIERHVPAVAWVDETSGNAEVYYRRANLSDQKWDEWCGSATGTGISGGIGAAARPVLTFAMGDGNIFPTQKPMIAWENRHALGEEIHLKQAAWLPGMLKYDWSALGTDALASLVSTESAHASAPTISFDEASLPMVAWSETFANGNREIYLRRWTGDTWVSDWGSAVGGGISATTGASTLPVLVTDGYATRVVAWEEQTVAGSRVYVKRLDANNWVELDGSGSLDGLSKGGGTDASMGTALVIMPDGNPAAAFMQSTTNPGSSFLCVKKWNGNDWVGLGGSNVSPGVSNPMTYSIMYDRPSMAVAPDGTLYVAWSQKLDSNSVWYYSFVRKWNGSVWTELAGLTTQVSGGTQPAIAIDPDGNPVVAFAHKLQYNGQEDIYVRGWNGSAWVAYGNSATGSGISTTPAGVTARPSLSPTIRVDAQYRPVVAWVERISSGPTKIWLRRWAPLTQTWDELVDDGGQGSANGLGVSKEGSAGTNADSPSLALDAAGNPCLAWSHQGRVVYRQWDGVAWQALGDSTYLDPVGTGALVSMQLDHKGWPVIAWDGIYLRRWDGASWVEEGRSASLGGVGGAFRYPGAVSTSPALALDRWGNASVCWHDRLPGSPSLFHVYFRQRPNWAPILGGCGQYRSDGVAIPAGAISTEEGVVIRASVDDPNGQGVTLEVQVLPAAQAFSDATPFVTAGPFLPGGTGAVTVSLPGSGRYLNSYHWRIRARDPQLYATAWLGFNGQPDDVNDADFKLRSNEAPVARSAGQFHFAGGAIPDGAVLDSEFHVAFTAQLDDEDLDGARFEIECRPVDQALVGAPTASSPDLAPGGLARIDQPLAPGRYHWQYRAVDAFNKPSAWASWGGSPAFSFLGGSFGNTRLSCSAGGQGGAILGLLLLAMVVTIRIRA